MKIGYIRKRAGLPDVEAQAYAIAQAGVDRGQIWREGHSEQSFTAMLESVRPGDVVVVYALKALAPDKTQSKRRPMRVAGDALEAIERHDVDSVQSVSEGKTYTLPADAGALSRDALNAIASHRKPLPVGRPLKPGPSDEDKARAMAIWKSLDHKTNASALAALKDIGWSQAMAYRHLGPSGRDPGRTIK